MVVAWGFIVLACFHCGLLFSIVFANDLAYFVIVLSIVLAWRLIVLSMLLVWFSSCCLALFFYSGDYGFGLFSLL